MTAMDRSGVVMRDVPARPAARWIAPTMMGIGLATIVSGVIVFESDAKNSGDGPSINGGRYVGLAMSMAGSAAIGVGTYVLCRERLGLQRLPAGLLAGGTAALFYGVTLYAVDQDPSPDLGTHVVNSAPAGIVIGSAGLAAAGAGLWLTLHGDVGRPPPVVALQRSGAVLRWGGTF